MPGITVTTRGNINLIPPIKQSALDGWCRNQKTIESQTTLMLHDQWSSIQTTSAAKILILIMLIGIVVFNVIYSK